MSKVKVVISNEQNEMRIPTTVRQVIIPTLNDTEENVLSLKDLIRPYSCVDKMELLPFRKICQVKYDQLHRPFPFAHLPEPDAATIKNLERILIK